jgi:hypothetical protein
MIKGKPPVLFVVAGIVVLSVVAVFVFSRTMRENVRAMMSILPQKYDATTVKPSPSLNNENGSPPPIANGQQEEAGTATNTPPRGNDNTPADNSVYRNDEFGFEFSIPEGWKVIENPHGSPYSYFNLILEPLDGKAAYPNPVLVNIVKPEFVGMSYADLKPVDSSITIDGMKGVKYKYPFEGGNITDIIIPRPKNTAIIGAWDQYKGAFNEVVSSFKFLNSN